jgi:hypothetical protein
VADRPALRPGRASRPGAVGRLSPPGAA